MSIRAITATSIKYTSAANQTRNFNATGTFFYCTFGTDIEVTVWDDTKAKLADTVVLIPGRGFKFPDNSAALGYQVQIRSPTAQVVQLDVIDGEIIDNSYIVNSNSAVFTTPSKTTLTSATAAISAVAGATTLINAGAANQRQRWIRNGHATDVMYVRGTNATVQSAMAVVAGGILLVENQSALYAYVPGANAIPVYVDVETTT